MPLKTMSFKSFTLCWLAAAIAAPAFSQTPPAGGAPALPTPATAPATPPTTTVAPSGPVADIIQAEDIISVVVANHPEMSLENVTVANGGTVTLPYAGAVHVAGKTPEQAAEAIAKPLRRQLRTPRVTVLIRQSRPQRVFVLGAVARPGVYDLPRNGGAAEALALAGGGAPRAALTQAVIKRADGTSIPVDLLKAGGQPEINLQLKPGDVLMVPESQARITLRGAVQKPGVFDIAEGESVPVSEALALAGGAAPRAALSRATVTRADGTTAPVDLYKAAVLGQPEANVKIGAGDVLTVPAGNGVTILGAVQKPGVLDLQGDRIMLTEAIAQAGGLTAPPIDVRISLSRSGADGQTQISTVDALKLLSLRDPSQNIALREGDLVSVAAREAQTVFISGEVKNPGAYEVKEGDSVPELLVRAGGPTPIAALSRISVVKRDGSNHNVNVASALVEGGARPADFPLQQGDFIVVPQNKNVVLVMGAVAQPGRQAIPETGQLTLGDALAAAGGVGNRAKIKEIALLRQDAKAPGGVAKEIVSLQGAKDGKLVLNQVLQSGTIVYVPEGKEGSSLNSILNSVSTLAAILF